MWAAAALSPRRRLPPMPQQPAELQPAGTMGVEATTLEHIKVSLQLSEDESSAPRSPPTSERNRVTSHTSSSSSSSLEDVSLEPGAEAEPQSPSAAEACARDAGMPSGGIGHPAACGNSESDSGSIDNQSNRRSCKEAFAQPASSDSAAKDMAVVVPAYASPGGGSGGGGGAVLTSPFAAAGAQDSWHARQASLDRAASLASSGSVGAGAAFMHGRAASAAVPPTPPQNNAAPLPPLGPAHTLGNAAASGELPAAAPRLPAGRRVPPLWLAGSGNGLNGALGPARSASLRRASGCSTESGRSTGSPVRLPSRCAPEAAQQHGAANALPVDCAHGGDHFHQPAHLDSTNGARRSILRMPASAPHSPRQKHNDCNDHVKGGAAGGRGLPPRRRQLSWDAGTLPLDDDRLRSLAADCRAGSALGFADAAAAAGQRGFDTMPAMAAVPQREEPNFFDPNAHAARLQREREAPAAAAAEWQGEVPAWHWAPQRAAIEAAARAPPPVDSAAAQAAAEAEHLARETRWRRQRRALELGHARQREAATARAAAKAKFVAAARHAAASKGRAITAACFALGAAAGLQMAAQQQRHGSTHAGAASPTPARIEAVARRAVAAQASALDIPSSCRRVSFQTDGSASPTKSVPPSPTKSVPALSPRPSPPPRSPKTDGANFAAAKAASKVALGGVRAGFERAGAAKLHFEGVRRRHAGGRCAAVVDTALKRVTDQRQTVFKAHYQYLLFLRNTFERASGSAGGGSAARELAEAMCRESRALRRVLDLEVRETRVVCKGWSDSLAWLEGREAGAEKLRHVLLSAHSRLENISMPFTQAVGALDDIFSALLQPPAWSQSAPALASPLGTSPQTTQLLPHESASARVPEGEGSQTSPQRTASAPSDFVTTASLMARGQPLRSALRRGGSAGGMSPPPSAMVLSETGGSSPPNPLPPLSPNGARLSPRSPAPRSPGQQPVAALPSAAATSAAFAPPQDAGPTAAGSGGSAAESAAGLEEQAAGRQAGGSVADADLQKQLMASLQQLAEARTHLAARTTEVSAMRARVTLQQSYIEQLEDLQSGYQGESGCTTPTRGGRTSAEFFQVPATAPGIAALRRSLSGTFGSGGSLATLE